MAATAPQEPQERRRHKGVCQLGYPPRGPRALAVI